MKIPLKIKIAGHIYIIDMNAKNLFKGKTRLAGLSDTENTKISVVRQFDGKLRSKSQIEQTFMHELLHAIDEIYNGGSLKERQVEALSQGIYQVLKDAGMLK